MKIIDHRLYQDDDTPYPFHETPNQSGEMQPRYLVMHYTAGPSVDQAVSWLANPSSKASAHLVIGRDGSIKQLVEFNRIAWHAGRSHWNGISGLNRHSIGIELDNAGPLQHSGDGWRAWFGTLYPDDQVVKARHKNQNVMRGWHLYTPEQLYAALDVAAVLVNRYGLEDVLGHEDIAPLRKTDPGPAFPMDAFRSRLFGRVQGGEDDEEEPAYETTAVLNIRTGPGAHYYTLDQGPLPKNTRVQIVEEEGVWRQVIVLDEINGEVGLEGWLHGNYIKQI